MIVPANHPRHNSLQQRQLLEEGMRAGIVTPTGMIAFGRGEAFDYLLGEKTSAQAKKAARAAAAQLLLAKKPVISVNGNAAVLAVREIIALAKTVKAKIGANVFYAPAKKRRELIVKHFKKQGASILGKTTDARIAGLSSERANVCRQGIFSADVVLVMLEDGDRTEALKKHETVVIAIDLNPLSRTAQKANITVVDNISRAVPLIKKEAEKLRAKKSWQLKKILRGFSNSKNLLESEKLLRRNLK